MEEDTTVNTKTVKQAGLVDFHAYSLIGAAEITTKDKKKVRLCLIRNPWGKKEWTGDWSDNSPLWDDHCKKQIPNFVAAKDG